MNKFDWERYLSGGMEVLSIDARRALRRARCERRRRVAGALVGAAVIISVVLLGAAPGV
jgi:hypothetical protein